MSGKDKRLDPGTDWDSEEEWEERERLVVANTHTQHWNNDKAEQTATSPGFVAFVRNDVGCGGWRKGGALMDPTQSKKASAQPETKLCISCDQPTTVWHSAERFNCDADRALDPQELIAHNQLCTACATDEEKCSECPYHPKSYYKNDVGDNPRVPPVVWRA